MRDFTVTPPPLSPPGGPTNPAGPRTANYRLEETQCAITRPSDNEITPSNNTITAPVTAGPGVNWRGGDGAVYCLGHYLPSVITPPHLYPHMSTDLPSKAAKICSGVICGTNCEIRQFVATVAALMAMVIAV